MKPTVRFWQTLIPPVIGGSARIRISEPHPVIGRIPLSGWVQTSEVQKVNEDGSFETLNTIYKKVE